MKYKQVTHGEWVSPVHDGYRMACCDCGLVHTMNFRTRKGSVQFQVFLNARATAAKRRYKEYDKT